MKVAHALALVALALSAAAQTPTWDTSGNSLLSGSYYFRHVVYLIADNAGDLGRAFALYGNITFSGSGTYTMNAIGFDSDAGVPQNFATSGTYSISASGYGFLSHPLSTGDAIFG